MERRSAALRAMADYDVSQRRACRLVGVDPKTVRRERVPDYPEIRTRMREIAAERRRFGYRRIGVMLEREGITMNLTQPPDPGRLFGDSVRLSFWLGVGGQGPLSGALA
jgi:hypothetical protein